MASLLSLISSSPTRTLSQGEVLIVQGEAGGDLFVLEGGELIVERDGVEIARINQPGSTVGEMSVLVGTRNSATVRADREARVRVVRDAFKYIEQDPALALRLAAVVAGRLEATSALLVELSKQSKDKPSEQRLLDRIFSALQVTVAGKGEA